MADKNSPIGVMDSGVGGISVLRELKKIMPEENFIYYGDSANAPYGEKPTETVRELTFNVVRYLMDRDVKGIVVACNTATAAAVRKLRETYPMLPLVGIEPAVKPAATAEGHPRVLVLATPVTIREEKLALLIGRFKTEADIIPVACPGLMEYVEAGKADSVEVEEYLTRLLKPYLNEKIDGLVLGCTHYPFVEGAIRKIVGKDTILYNGGEGTAREMKRRLSEAGLLTTRDSNGEVEFITSCGNEKKLELCRELFMRK